MLGEESYTCGTHSYACGRNSRTSVGHNRTRVGAQSYSTDDVMEVLARPQHRVHGLAEDELPRAERHSRASAWDGIVHVVRNHAVWDRVVQVWDGIVHVGRNHAVWDRIVHVGLNRIIMWDRTVHTMGTDK